MAVDNFDREGYGAPRVSVAVDTIRPRGAGHSTANNYLRVLRRILNLAVEWNVLSAAPKVKVLSGERRREGVITSEEEARYLAAAPDVLASTASVLTDTGMRPELCFRLCSENVTWLNGRNGVLLMAHGKIAAARRVIPMTPRAPGVQEARWQSAGKPEDGCVWPAQTRSGHIEPYSLRNQHARTFKTLAEEVAKRNEKPVRPFVLYSLRHTFLTRLGNRARCMDAGEDRRARLNQHLVALRPPIRRCGSGRDFEAGWAPNWAQSKRSAAVARCEGCDKRRKLNQFQAMRP